MSFNSLIDHENTVIISEGPSKKSSSSSAPSSSKLLHLFDQNDGDVEENEITTDSAYRTNETSNYLDGSTVPTYEEFTGKSRGGYRRKSSILFRKPSTLESLLSEDESAPDDDCDSAENENNDSNTKNFKSNEAEKENDSPELAENFSNISIRKKIMNEIVPMSLPTFNRTRPKEFSSSKMQVIDDSPPQQQQQLQQLQQPKTSKQMPLQVIQESPPPKPLLKIKHVSNNLVHHSAPTVNSSCGKSQQSTIIIKPRNLKFDLQQPPPKFVHSPMVEYATCDSKQIQTSFSLSFLDTPSKLNAAEEASESSSVVVSSKKPADQTTMNNNGVSFKLYLSSTDSNEDVADDSASDEIKSTTKAPLLTIEKKSADLLPKSKRRKRVSMCGVDLPEKLLAADESQLDEMENENDIRNGFIFTLDETEIDRHNNNNQADESNDHQRVADRKSVAAASNNLLSILEVTNDESELSSGEEAQAHAEQSSNYKQFEKFLIDSQDKRSNKRDKQLTNIINESAENDEENIEIIKSPPDQRRLLTINRNKEAEATATVRRSSLLNESSSSSSSGSPQRAPSIQTTQQPKKKASSNSEDSDERFEKFLRDQKAKLDEKKEKALKSKSTASKKKDSFIVDDEDDDDDEEEEESSEETAASSKVSRSIKKLVSSSSSDDATEKDRHLFYIKTTKKLIDKENKKLSSSKKTARSSLLNCTSSCSEDEDDDEKSVISISTSESSDDSSLLDDSAEKRYKSKDFRTKVSNQIDFGSFRTPSSKLNRVPESRLVKTAQQQTRTNVRYYTFIESLSSQLDNEERRDPSVAYFLTNFRKKKVKIELMRRIYDEANELAFKNQLPLDMELNWNERLRSTAGHCRTKIIGGIYKSSIEISSKVCDTAERLRDVLVHEMCHAACNHIDKNLKAKHGPLWKNWTIRVQNVFKRIPPITVFHNYSIKMKFTFKCTKCGLRIFRFSKSIDVEKELCGICHGRFIILKDGEPWMTENDFERVAFGDEQQKQSTPPASECQQTPRKPPQQLNKFAQFVKENYNSVKKAQSIATHKDVMQELSKQFKNMAHL